MNYLISSKEEFFSLKKANNISIYTENFELFCLLKKHGVKYFFSNFLLNKSKNSDKIIEVFSKNWFLDQVNKDIFDVAGISISNSINRRLSIKFTYILRAYFAIQHILKKKSSLKISSNCNNNLLLVSEVFKEVEIINFKKKNKKNLYLSHSPDRAKGFTPNTYLLGKILRVFQKFFVKGKVIYFSDNTSIYSAKKNNQILIQNSTNIFRSFYYCKNNFLNSKYEKLLSKKISNYNENLINQNIIKILYSFSVNDKSAKNISKIYLSLLKRELKIHKKILSRSLSVYEDLFKFYKPKYVIQNGESGFDNILISELCKLYKIKNILMIDGYQLFVDKFIFFKTKRNNKLSFDKVFAYGSANEQIYLNHGFKKKNIIKINSPILDKINDLKKIDPNKPMILGYQSNLNCYQTPFDIQIKIELDLIKLLQDLKFKSAIVKIKDGDRKLNGNGIKNYFYYKKIFEKYFDKEMTINLEVVMGDLVEKLPKTKFILGGLSTSIIEALKCKVPYYFYEPAENGYNKKVLDSIKLFTKNKIARDIFMLKKNITNENFIPFKMKNIEYSKSLFHINFKNI